MTMQLNDRVNECARTLGDGQLLAKLSGGDVVAQELKYHPLCLVGLYNIESPHLKSLSDKQSKHNCPVKGANRLAFSELVTYINETKNNSESTTLVVFRLADLAALYKQRLQQFGPLSQDINTTRLKEHLLEQIPELEAHRRGRDILLAFRKDVSSVLSQGSEFTEALVLTKVAKILRHHMLDFKTKFDGMMCEGSVEDAVPATLVQFVCMIEHGADIKSQLRFGASKTDLAMAQLLQYNCYARYKEGSATHRHAKDHETPFPEFIGMSIFSKTRKKHLVEMLHENGISISYSRVLEISAKLGDAVVNRYAEDELVCPPALRRHVCTTSAMDNIDHNPTATTATTSFHGTAFPFFSIQDLTIKVQSDNPSKYEMLR